jgi:hypothetical protein
MRTLGFSRNLGGTVKSTSPEAGGGRLNKPQALRRRVTRPEGAKEADADVVPHSEGNRVSGMLGSGRSTPMVPSKQGNLPQGSLWRDGGCREASDWLVQAEP